MLDYFQARAQWVVHRADKIPLRAVDGQRASSTNPADWVSYEFALDIAQQQQLGLGFVITPDDNLTCIDFDTYKTTDPDIIAEHTQIQEYIGGYKQLSPSGGVHLWVFGKAGTRNYRSKYIEVYDSAHYITMAPVGWSGALTDAADKLTAIVKHLDAVTGRTSTPTPAATTDVMEVLTDKEILVKCAQAATGDKFKMLYEGDYINYFAMYHPNQKDKSQSEADLALCNFIAFWTSNKKQVGRIFRMSALGKRDKAQRDDYLYHKSWGIVTKSFNLKTPPPTQDDIDTLAALRGQWKSGAAAVADLPEVKQIEWTLPRGLMSDLITHFYNSSLYQSPEVATAAALAFAAGMCGRSWNVSNTGLNLYIVLLAASAYGKEAATTGINNLAGALNPHCDNFADMFIGPSNVPSAPGLIKSLLTRPCVVAPMGEIGYWLQAINRKDARANDLLTKRCVLDLFTKSGATNVVGSSAYSDTQKNIQPLKAPSFTFIGDSTYVEFYKSVDENNIAEGLISRLLLINSRIKTVWNLHPQKAPETLLIALGTIGKAAKAAINPNGTIQALPVRMTPEATIYQEEYRAKIKEETEALAGDEENANPLSGIKSRSHLYMLRIAALVAVLADHLSPIIEVADLKWAQNMIDESTRSILNRFASGKIGIQIDFWGEQCKAVETVINKYKGTKEYSEKLMTHGITEQMWKHGVFTYKYVVNNVRGFRCFRLDTTFNKADLVRKALKEQMELTVISEIPKADALARYGHNAAAYQLKV
jgi:hypothetical protein